MSSAGLDFLIIICFPYLLKCTGRQDFSKAMVFYNDCGKQPDSWRASLNAAPSFKRIYLELPRASSPRYKIKDSFIIEENVDLGRIWSAVGFGPDQQDRVLTVGQQGGSYLPISGPNKKIMHVIRLLA
jgi:hypothetical protein